jgi:putative transcriptional regulator
MKEQDFNNLLKSVKQAGRIRRGEIKASRVHEFAATDVKAIRRRSPEGPARALLKIAAINPKAVEDALSA